MQHKDLDNRWHTFSIAKQMANIGSEIERAIKWKLKGNHAYADLANIRTLELFDLTLNDPKKITGFKEIARARELWLDFFIGENQYHQTDQQWQKYIYAFTIKAQLEK